MEGEEGIKMTTMKQERKEWNDRHGVRSLGMGDRKENDEIHRQDVDL